MSSLTRAGGAAVTAATAAVIVAGSHVRMPEFVSPDAMVRVSWSARPERIEQCVRVSAEELERTPVHMRREMVCEGTTARYRLEVDRNGVLVDSVTVRGGGLRRDREVYVYREIFVPAAQTRIAVRFLRVDSSATADGPDSNVQQTRDSSGALAVRAVREQEERARRIAEAIPPVLTLDTVVTLASRAVILVTYDPLVRRLIVKTGTP